MPSETRQFAQRCVGPGEAEDELVVVDQLRGQRSRDECVIATARPDDAPGLGGSEVSWVQDLLRGL
ncbi:MAG: hypothetical protein AUG00_00370 [Candidatus Rokubacteria bacterium 13_1_20CM_2_70_7]|nr:MAG: hypothetical protein AUG00_00370 [Candidatus Rokubacteria bacterium 13_1_20CM_2_70_7]